MAVVNDSWNSNKVATRYLPIWKHCIFSWTVVKYFQDVWNHIHWSVSHPVETSSLSEVINRKKWKKKRNFVHIVLWILLCSFQMYATVYQPNRSNYGKKLQNKTNEHVMTVVLWTWASCLINSWAFYLTLTTLHHLKITLRLICFAFFCFDLFILINWSAIFKWYYVVNVV